MLADVVLSYELAEAVAEIHFTRDSKIHCQPYYAKAAMQFKKGNLQPYTQFQIAHAGTEHPDNLACPAVLSAGVPRLKTITPRQPVLPVADRFDWS
jgi:hypothetical protein